MSPRFTITLGDFSATAVREEAAHQEVTVEELLHHAVLYYLADRDSGRVAARVFAPGEQPEGSGRRFDRDTKSSPDPE